MIKALLLTAVMLGAPLAAEAQNTRGTAPADAGARTDIGTIVRGISQRWTPNCGLPGSDQVVVDIRFMIAADGRISKGPEWLNPRNDPLWEASASRAIGAVKAGEPYTNLPAAIYNRPIEITFDAARACGK